MSILYLECMDLYGFYLYDPEEPSFRYVRPRGKSKVEDFNRDGFASRRYSLCWRYLVAVYLQNGTLYLQINRKRWDLLDPGVAVTWKSKFCVSAFKVLVNGKCEFSHYYRTFTCRAMNHLGHFPDYTEYEMMFDDIFFFLADHPDPKGFWKGYVDTFTEAKSKPNIMEEMGKKT